MRRGAQTSARVAALCLLLAGTATAEVTPPPWPADADQAAALTLRTNEHVHFGGLRSSAAVQVHVAPDRKAQFTTSMVAAPATAEGRDAAASAELGVLAATARALGAEIEATTQRYDEVGKFLDATIRWRDSTLGVRQLGRTLVVASADTLVAATAECALALDAPPAHERACTDALASLAPSIAASERVTLALVSSSPPAVAASEPTGAAAPASGSHDALASSTAAPSLDVPRTGMTPMTISSAPADRDRRPMYLGFGIFVLAIVFWWNRRQRDRFDHEEPGDRAKPRRRRGDDDADDLHAAARGDAKDE